MGHIVTMDMVCASLAFLDGLGGPEMVLIFVVVLVLFGGQKLPEFARGFGKSIREFKKAAAGVEEEFKRALEEDERKNTTPKIAAAPAVPASTMDDPAGPESSVHSPGTDDDVTSESDHSSEDGSAAYDEGYPASDDVPSEEIPSSSEDATPPSDDIPPSSDDEPAPAEISGTPPAEPKILPPVSPSASTPPKPSPPPPATHSPENPS